MKKPYKNIYIKNSLAQVFQKHIFLTASFRQGGRKYKHAQLIKVAAADTFATWAWPTVQENGLTVTDLIFTAFDKDRNGWIDFNEFILATYCTVSEYF